MSRVSNSFYLGIKIASPPSLCFPFLPPMWCDDDLVVNKNKSNKISVCRQRVNLHIKHLAIYKQIIIKLKQSQIRRRSPKNL